MNFADYLSLSKRERRKLFKNAQKGNVDAERRFREVTKSIASEVNKRLRALEKSALDYGGVYNNVIFFTQTEYNTNRFKMPNQLGEDFDDMFIQNEQGFKFLRTNSSTIGGARNAERHRIQALQENGALPEDFSYRQSKEFLRFLGNEEVSATLDEYGRSNQIVAAYYDHYVKYGIDGLSAIKTALGEYLAFKNEDSRYTFDYAMERVGIKIEDYISRKPTS